MMGLNAPPVWLPLRDELRLYAGPPTHFGAPTWTLHDPITQQFFRLGWQEVEIIQRWLLGSPEAIAQNLAETTMLNLPPAAIASVQNFLTANNLLIASSRADTARLQQQLKTRKKSWWSVLMHNYLFLRIPLWSPDDFLTATVGAIRYLTSRTFLILWLILSTLGALLILRQWSQFSDSFSSLLTWRGAAIAALALSLSKAAHEFGHAYSAKMLNLKVPSMGIALMCFAPVLWTDTTEAWKLPRRRERLFIGASGVFAELLLAGFAALAWSILPIGALKTGAFMLASSIWILTLLINLNPCMRYDGYYLLADFWDIPSLQPRSFALAKWWMREKLFGFNLPPPEIFQWRARTKLIAYALAMWIYRFFLFLGIAFLVYHFFFKALGIILMAVELIFFIAAPILKEIIHWIKVRDLMKINRHLFFTTSIALIFCALMLIPWHTQIGGAAILSAARHSTLYAPVGALIEKINVSDGAIVAGGELLFKLHSPDLAAKIALTRKQLTAEKEKLSLFSLDFNLRSENVAEWEIMWRCAEDLAGLLREQAKLEIRAPFAGRIIELPRGLNVGDWVAGKEPLLTIAGVVAQVEIFVPEYLIERLKIGATGLFYPSGRGWSPRKIRVCEIEQQAATEIADPELTNVYGGILGAHRTPDGRLVPEQASYRVVCAVVNNPQSHASTISDDAKTDGADETFLIGEASLSATPQSLVAEIWRKFMGILIRESGW